MTLMLWGGEMIMHSIQKYIRQYSFRKEIKSHGATMKLNRRTGNTGGPAVRNTEARQGFIEKVRLNRVCRT